MCLDSGLMALNILATPFLKPELINGQNSSAFCALHSISSQPVPYVLADHSIQSSVQMTAVKV